ncbi:MAG: GlsB/YeaQ/YmgE family stress response membrane protein [Rhodopirellula sp.]|nr:GlsB/YeaQ/YmgE family stress response membrane protein [Rhodopirellula sp.]
MGITTVVSWIVFGLIVGAIARLLMPGRQNMGWLMTIVLGIVGSFAGGALSTLLFGSSDGGFHPGGWIMSIIGALILLIAYSTLAAKKH